MRDLTPDQIRHLATTAGVHPDTVRRFVRGQEVRQDNRAKLLQALRGPQCAHLGWLLRRHGS